MNLLPIALACLLSQADPYEGWNIQIDEAKYYDCFDYEGSIVCTVTFPAGEGYTTRIWAASVNPTSQAMLLEESGSTDAGDRLYSETWGAPDQIAVSGTGDYFYIVQVYKQNPDGGYFTPPLTAKGQFAYTASPPQMWEDARTALEVGRRIQASFP